MAKRSFTMWFVALVILSTGARAFSGELKSLKLLYVGDKARAGVYEQFLKQHVAAIESVDRHGFKPAYADGFDVVVLDWPQGEETRDMHHLTSPLGERDKWSRPTVLLGSAGLNLAVAWKLKGGVGCTCLDPMAFNLREHPIFDTPFKIDRSKLISIATPEDFKEEISDQTIQVLPLSNGATATVPGWCTYTPDFARYPDVELFCGGVNHKTPTAGALWRQANLLHFGFDLTPPQMTETGRLMLLNSIAYISRFTAERPIAVTPSVFAGKVTQSHEWIVRHTRNPRFSADYIAGLVAPEVRAELDLSSREKLLDWALNKARYLRPNSEQLLEYDPDLLAMKTAFDEPALLDALPALLDGEPSDRERAGRLIGRYIPEFTGPLSNLTFKTWLDENRRYLFASDSGDYRWYIDPLAKKRHIPTEELRGIRRADVARTTASE
jgi:hypothetical protein